MKDVAGRVGSIVLVLLGFAAIAPTAFVTLFGLFVTGGLAFKDGLNATMLWTAIALLVPTASLACLLWLTTRHRSLRLSEVPALVWTGLAAGVLAGLYMTAKLPPASINTASTWFKIGGGPLLLAPVVVFIIWYRGRNTNPE
ncbi:hypothetical protein [Denitromonas halophila]|uniref:Uncharacterized protein n=1 Tax=Denitromonas halophila TaxID=1629404 RepID=A0A557QY04_9RHOO|nr:hypothetical protein [Denitromonas halophila]TVO57791.1 hypothetical protein FHP91_08990 [Denitromonas halophila]